MSRSTLKSTLLYIAWQVLCTRVCSSDEEQLLQPNSTACFDNQELSFFCDAKVYADAKKACEAINATLVKIDNANMTEVVNLLIDQRNCSLRKDILIGGTKTPHPNFLRDGSKRIWTWLDGSPITKPNEAGYHNWQPGQPDNHAAREDCLMIHIRTKQWKDSLCSGDGEAKHYICQKNTTISIEVKSKPNKTQCLASACPWTPNAEWRRDGAIVPNKTSRSLYQTISSGSSILHYENATIGDAGEYICIAWIGDEKADPKLVSVSVNGTPNMTGLFACSNNLQVVWKPHIRSLGFRHRIITTSVRTEKLLNVTEVIPNGTNPHFTEIVGLEPSTTYNVKVVACKDTGNCSDEYAINKTATTLETIVTVTNVTMHQVHNETKKDKCVVTWVFNASATFLIIIHTEDGIHTIQTYNNSAITTNSYSFHPNPGPVYKVEIQLVSTNKKYCHRPVKAFGSCVGKKKQGGGNNQKQTPGVDLIFIIIPAAAVGAVLILSISIFCIRKRMKANKQRSNGMATNRSCDATYYGHLHSSSDKVNSNGDSSTLSDANDDQVAYATAEEPRSSFDAPIYASVYKPKIKIVVKENSSHETKKATKLPASNNPDAQSTEMMVTNPIYDMEASTSNGRYAPTPISEKRDGNRSVSDAPAVEDQQSATEDPIYTTVNKVKEKNKTVSLPSTDDDD